MIDIVDNYIFIDNRVHIFINFDYNNLALIQLVDPLANPEIHIFITNNTSVSNNQSIIDLMNYCIDIRERWSIPIRITLYSPIQHNILKLWIQDYFKNHRDKFNHIILNNMHKFVSLEPHEPNDGEVDNRLHEIIFEYSYIHRGQQILNVGIEINGEYLPLKQFDTVPSDDWISSGHPGFN